MEFQLLKKSARFLTLLLPLAFVACGGSNKPTEASPAPTQATTAKGCTGSYVGTIDKPSPEAVKAMREESLRRRGINPDDPIDRIQAVRTLEVSSEQEGIWMEGNFAFETDANCKVVKGGTNIFYTYPMLSKARSRQTAVLTSFGRAQAQQVNLWDKSIQTARFLGS
jgi:hypothetical protein